MQWLQYLLQLPWSCAICSTFGPRLSHPCGYFSCQWWEAQTALKAGRAEEREWRLPFWKHPGGHIWIRGAARQKSQGFWQCPLHSYTVLWKTVNARERKRLVPALFNAKLQIEFIVCVWWEKDEINLRSFLLEVSAMQCISYPHLLLNWSLRGKAKYSWMAKEKRKCF